MLADKPLPEDVQEILDVWADNVAADREALRIARQRAHRWAAAWKAAAKKWYEEGKWAEWAGELWFQMTGELEAERDGLRKRLAEVREELVRIRDRLIDRDPPYAVAIDRVLAVLREAPDGKD